MLSDRFIFNGRKPCLIFKFNYLDGDESPAVQPGSGDRVALRVVVEPSVLHVQHGQTVELNCVVYGADASTNIYWIQEEPERVKSTEFMFH